MADQTVVFMLLFYISAALSADSLNNILFNGDYEFIDLTHTFDENTVYWPGTKDFEFTKKIAKFIDSHNSGANQSWYALNEFAASEHGGTHLDAPYHFFKTGVKVGQIPMEKLIVPLVVVDISSKVNGNPDYVLYKQDLDHMLNVYNEKPCVIIFRFGWSRYFSDRNQYLGIDEKTNTLRFPGLSAEVAEWIITAYKNVVGVGVDAASVDPGSSTDFPVHQILSKAGVYNIEHVNMPTPISSYKCTALVLPMKIAAGTGAPLRLVAICPKETPESF